MVEKFSDKDAKKDNFSKQMEFSKEVYSLEDPPFIL